MFDLLNQATKEMRECIAAIDVDCIDGKSAVLLVGMADEARRLIDGLRTVAVGRVEKTEAWRIGGAKSAADWLSMKTGSGWGEAKNIVTLAENLRSLPQTEAALRSGQISGAQAVEVALGATASPNAESRLLSLATSSSVKTLREESRRVVAGAVTDERARYKAIYKSRYLRHRTEPDGAFLLEARLTPDAGALILSSLAPWRDAIYRDARSSGCHESAQAYAADALVVMCTAVGLPEVDEEIAGVERTGVERTSDERALVALGEPRATSSSKCRVSRTPEEPLSYIGGSEWRKPGGPVLTTEAAASNCFGCDPAVNGWCVRKGGLFAFGGPTGMACACAEAGCSSCAGGVQEPSRSAPKRRSRDPGPRAVITIRVDADALRRGMTEGDEVCEIPGVGPIPVAMALELANDAFLKVLVTDGTDILSVAHAGRTIPARLRTALEERDLVCRVPHCDMRFGLEIDHRIPFAQGGPTNLENLVRICAWHHRQKTYDGYQLVEVEGEGGVEFAWLPPAPQERDTG